ncbi:NAD-dependent epimerase/dehydratase family protein [Pseudomonas chlororaphis]|uniref:NAD-dependent epimerase/dehydratase family protein n=1 Tax=Pseudomonas chlororaphis TaxID=587753 RepID=UPI002408075A|nr:NAD-dependent epimerase/dehydratase family protein [Pseudomonas chlororaphis]
MSLSEEPERILLTGGAGFVGSNVVKILRERYPDAALRVLHLPRENLLNLNGLDEVELMVGDITDAADVARAVSDCDVVFHLAAIYAFWLPDMSLMQRVNVEGTRLVLEECLKQRVKRVVYTSSASCFAGHGLDIVSTEQFTFALGNQAYARSKHDSHVLAEAYAARGLDVVIVCPVVPMGPGDVGPTPSGRLITDIFTLPLALAPSSEMNIIDVRDCAMGHVLALEKGCSGESYILGGENYRYKDMLRRVLRLCGLRRTIVELSPMLLWPVAHAMVLATRFTGKPPLLTPAEIDLSRRGLVCDAAKARRELGLVVRPLEQTLRDALGWFVEHGYITEQKAVERFQQTAPAASP